MPTPDTAVNAIADRFWEGLLRESPTTATAYGDERYDDLLDDPSPAGARRHARSASGRWRRSRSSPRTASRWRSASPAT